MIEGMVGRLAQRMAENGSDVDGWLRLIRAYSVLGEREKALSAAANARAALAGNSDNLRRIGELAKELGLEGSMTRKQRRLILIGSSLGVLAIAVALVLSSLRESIVFFNSPTDIAESKAAPGKRVRLGGLVKMGSVERGDNLQIRLQGD